ncbi:MAG TPA: hypothetical protein VGQ83_22495 [Polyangia bacterium]|jgi:hypothetical protein
MRSLCLLALLGAPAAAAAAPPAPLPAGLSAWDYGRSLCEGCAVPAAAVVAGFYDAPERAARELRRWRRRDLALGNPSPRTRTSSA